MSDIFQKGDYRVKKATTNFFCESETCRKIKKATDANINYLLILREAILAVLAFVRLQRPRGYPKIS